MIWPRSLVKQRSELTPGLMIPYPEFNPLTPFRHRLAKDEVLVGISDQKEGWARGSESVQAEKRNRACETVNFY